MILLSSDENAFGDFDDAWLDDDPAGLLTTPAGGKLPFGGSVPGAPMLHDSNGPGLGIFGPESVSPVAEMASPTQDYGDADYGGSPVSFDLVSVPTQERSGDSGVVAELERQKGLIEQERDALEQERSRLEQERDGLVSDLELTKEQLAEVEREKTEAERDMRERCAELEVEKKTGLLEKARLLENMERRVEEEAERCAGLEGVLAGVREEFDLAQAELGRMAEQLATERTERAAAEQAAAEAAAVGATVAAVPGPQGAPPAPPTSGSPSDMVAPPFEQDDDPWADDDPFADAGVAPPAPPGVLVGAAVVAPGGPSAEPSAGGGPELFSISSPGDDAEPRLELQTLQSEVEELRATLAAQESKHHTAAQTASAELLELRTEHAELQSVRERLQHELQSVREQLAHTVEQHRVELERHVEASNDSLNDWRTNCEQIEAQVQTHQNDLRSLEQLRSEHEQLRGEHQSVLERIAVLEQEKSRVEAELNQSAESWRSEREHLSSSQLEAVREAERAAIERAAAEHQRQNQTALSEADLAKSEADTLRSKMEKLQKELEETQDQISQSTFERSSISEQMERMRGIQEELRWEKEAMEADLETLRVERESWRMEKDELNASLAQTQQEKEEQETELEQMMAQLDGKEVRHVVGRVCGSSKQIVRRAAVWIFEQIDGRCGGSSDVLLCGSLVL